MNYYRSHPFVANSDLSKLEEELGSRDFRDYAEALRFGTLVHAIILEPEKVDQFRYRIVDEPYQYSKDDFDTARKMKVSFLNDSFCRGLLSACTKEVEMFNPDTRFTHQGIDFTLNTKRKYDMWFAPGNYGGDLKSTTATSQQAFEASINMFDYDRARVFYAMGPGAVQDVIIGVSKVRPYRVFKVFMRQNDPLWLRGIEKCNEIAYRYWALKEVAV